MVQTTARDLHGRRALVSGRDLLVTARSQPQDVDPELFIAAELASAERVATAVAALSQIAPIGTRVRRQCIRGMRSGSL